ncbi:hypothetical protein GCM10010191_05430 [Actinomadura vinacea]|uniref:AAA+ ATPase domain-containing protein n=1 Tax=Actinomadura vinacea TaxID=115336 RepID=A0ABN3ICR9_9ACTN
MPEHLELLVSDEPLLDLYSYGPWRVPDGLYEEIRARVDALVADPRCAELTTDRHGFLENPAPLVVAELVVVTEFLTGASAVIAGSHSRLGRNFFGHYRRTRPDPLIPVIDWGVSGGAFLPINWLQDAPDLDLALALNRELLDVFDGLAPLEARRRALMELYEDPPPGFADLHPAERPGAWAAHAGDETVAVLPELAGPIGYLEWTCAGLLPVHEHLLRIAPHEESTDELLVHLLLQGGLTQVPAELAAVVGEDAYAELLARFAAERAGFDPEDWRTATRSWLARALVAGAGEACRGWLDMAVRFTGAVQGFPGDARAPNPVRVPVGEFTVDVRRLFAPRRRVVNPLAEGLRRTPSPAGDARPAKVDSGLIGQPDAVAALEEIAAGGGPVRLLLTGPDGTGKRDTAQEIVRLLAERSITERPLWLAGDFFAAKEVSAATTVMFNDARECAGKRLMIIDGLDVVCRDERSGEAIVEELHRAVDVHDDLHFVALCEPGGDALLREVNPALALRFKVVPTHPFDAAGYAGLFDRALRERGARADEEALTAAGELLVRTPPVRNLRNARLAHHLAGTVADAVRERTAPGEEPVAGRADIPASLDTAATPGDPMAELAALTGLGTVKQEIELIAAGAEAARLRREAGLPATPAPARHMVFTGGPGTGKTVVARLVARLFKDLGVLSSGHLVEASRARLVGQYLGETAAKTRGVVRRAVGGVLFIDEAYALTQSTLDQDYGSEAVAELLKAMEDHRDDLVVIAAGYEREMSAFLAANPGLESRIPKRLVFPDYSEAELVEIFEHLAAAEGLTLAPDVPERLRGLLRDVPRGPSFGNGRLMRNLLDAAIAVQGERLTEGDRPDDGEITTLRAADLRPVTADEPGNIGLYL